MKTNKNILVSANEAVAKIAYKTNEIFPIYPITPASKMSELVEEWSAKNQKNIFGNVPIAYEMQSEAGVAGTMHGALQTGSLSTTFTASQGLLLMLPNMYKIAGELTPNVIHVATRAIATHALSIFSDHSDVMAVRSSGYAMLASASVQEAMDFALIAQSATLKSRIPFVHFFDGFRTSHETQSIENISDAVISDMMDEETILRHRNNALSPENPTIRGTAQGPDVFFQSREAVNSFYNACPDIVQKQMDKFAKLTGRQYRLFDYVGHPQAEQIIVSMASSTETIEETVNHLNTQGEKVGLVKVRLFRPFSTKHLLRALPKSCKKIAVLNRTKEPGATGEPLYLDVCKSLLSVADTYSPLPKIVGGRYGLSSKELCPGMVKAVFDNLKLESPKNNFTIGIEDDVTNLSLSYANDLHLQGDNLQILLYETKSEGLVSGFKNTIQTVGSENYVQGYSEIDYKKSGSRFVSNLRIGKQPIKAPYLIPKADFIACDSVEFLENDNVMERIKTDGKLLVQTTLTPEEFWARLSSKKQNEILIKNIRLFTLNGNTILKNYAIGHKSISGLHSCVLALQENLMVDEDLKVLQEFVIEVENSKVKCTTKTSNEADVEFANSLLGKLMAGRGDELPVSALPADGTYPTNTSQFIQNRNRGGIPVWDSDSCTQCGACSMACPQAAIRIKVYDDKVLSDSKSLKSINSADFNLMNYTVQVNPEQCTSCNLCVDACTDNVLKMTQSTKRINTEKENWECFETIPEFDGTKLDVTRIGQQQLQEPLFKYSIGVDGCGEAPYLKLLSQLFGDRMLVANATGASSIFCGALPSTPWAKNKQGRGPAWSNSLFEDNAEFGLGFHLSLELQRKKARQMLSEFRGIIDETFVEKLLHAPQNSEAEIAEQRNRVGTLKSVIEHSCHPKAKQLMCIADNLVKKSTWIVGGDGWAYDIGYGGLDHVLASGENVNILVLDNEVYSNTGAQQSKATPMGASTKFNFCGKRKLKKDLGAIAMNYDNVYVASVALGADQQQTLNAFIEAESFEGPSLILAYCHSPAHSIAIKSPSKHQKAAVAAGHWILYRNDPRRLKKELNAFQLDSPVPSEPISEFFKLESRFKKALTNAKFMKEIQEKNDRRFQFYSEKAHTDQLNHLETINQ
ncbi:4Fe-4S binding protein [Allomuricauda sp. d1]|uniref:4Fe-4S binding protein n=1 Tax=Allomuricauda sp. d1 TaxID=3136725 RepID=UPI0031D3998C